MTRGNGLFAPPQLRPTTGDSREAGASAPTVALNVSGGRVADQFHARDVNLLMSSLNLLPQGATAASSTSVTLAAAARNSSHWARSSGSRAWFQ